MASHPFAAFTCPLASHPFLVSTHPPASQRFAASTFLWPLLALWPPTPFQPPIFLASTSLWPPTSFWPPRLFSLQFLLASTCTLRSHPFLASNFSGLYLLPLLSHAFLWSKGVWIHCWMGPVPAIQGCWQCC